MNKQPNTGIVLTSEIHASWDDSSIQFPQNHYQRPQESFA